MRLPPKRVVYHNILRSIKKCNSKMHKYLKTQKYMHKYKNSVAYFSRGSYTEKSLYAEYYGLVPKIEICREVE